MWITWEIFSLYLNSNFVYTDEALVHKGEHILFLIKIDTLAIFNTSYLILIFNFIFEKVALFYLCDA